MTSGRKNTSRYLSKLISFGICLVLAGTSALILSSCETDSTTADEAKPVEDLSALDANPSGDAAANNQLADSSQPPIDDFAQFDDPPPKEAPPLEAAKNEDKKDEFAQFDENPPVEAKKEEPKQEPPPAEPPPETIAKAQEPPPPAVEIPPPAAEPPPPAPEAPAPVVSTGGINNIRSIQFKGNDNGGTVVIDADGPLTYTTRMNTQSGQFVIDIPNSILSKKLTRPLITKDFVAGGIGSVDAYQTKGTQTSRVVVHLKPGSSEPIVQAEGNSILVVSSEAPKEVVPEPEPQPEAQLQGVANLSQFLTSENNFTGKKINIETGDDMELGEILRFLADEGGINVVLGLGEKTHDKVKLKLRQVPWDQVMLMVMRSHKLGYSRTGNVLRIVPVTDLQLEEKESIDATRSKRDTAPLIVKMIPISYADVGTLGDKVKSFLSPRGTFFTDPRTASLVVSDIEENIDRVQKVIKSIDIPPQQVLIEGKIVEAQENFTRQIGVQWQAPGLPQYLGQGGSGNITSTVPITVSPSNVSASTASVGLQLGILDILGDLTATLTLQEQEGNIHVLASPRVVTMHNEPAKMSETQEIPFKTAQPTQIGTPIAQVSFKAFKLDMEVTPLITNDGGVIMKINVVREFPGDVIDQASQARPLNNRTASTRVLVRNGQTAVIGGIYQNDTNYTEYRVPWIGSLPVIGWLFKGTTRGNNKNELLIFVTPRILAQLDGKAVSENGGEGTAQ